MRPHRLDRLTRLTQGAALVGLGALAAACNDTPKTVNSPEPQPTEPIHVNATAEPTPSATATPPPSASAAPSAAPSASWGKPTINAPPKPPPSMMPHMNAPPNTPPRTNG
jgi:hypothetical protein